MLRGVEDFRKASDARFEGLLHSIEDLRKSFDERFSANDRRFESLERRLNFLMWFIGIFFTVTNILIVVLKLFG